MAVQQLQQGQSSLWRPDDKEYLVAAPNAHVVKLYWSEMTRWQKLLQIEAEKRAVYEANFNPCGLA